jgi:hypothetical protein
VEPNSTIDILVKFKYVDKYESFHEIHPGTLMATAAQRQTVTIILDACCEELIRLLERLGKTTGSSMKKSLVHCMDELSRAGLDTPNLEFAWELGWYLAEKVSIDLRKGTGRKVWGYWSVESDEVKTIGKPRKKKQLDTSTSSTGVQTA